MIIPESKPITNIVDDNKIFAIPSNDATNNDADADADDENNTNNDDDVVVTAIQILDITGAVFTKY